MPSEPRYSIVERTYYLDNEEVETAVYDDEQSWTIGDAIHLLRLFKEIDHNVGTVKPLESITYTSEYWLVPATRRIWLR